MGTAPVDTLRSRTIVLGVTGGIAAYKSIALASLLVQAGATVRVVMTESAQRFVQPLAFAAITHSEVHSDPFAPWIGTFSGHVSLAATAELVIVAPATAASIARIALGLADDLLGLIALSTSAPLLIAPAMEDRMFHHAATQEHLKTLVARGATIVGPEHGRLASGEYGQGRMAEPEAIAQAAATRLSVNGILSGIKVVVTAGGTRELIDPVRYIGNRSSGLMGFALATAALAAGANVTVITGPTHVDPPHRAQVIQIETAEQMLIAVDRATRDADLLIMAAAVADFRPEAPQSRKIKKNHLGDNLELRLARTVDILAEIDRPGLVKIGFAAETDDLLENATRKLRAKNLAMIVANDAVQTIGAAESQATLLTADGTVRALPPMAKDALAVEIIRTAATLLPTAEPRSP